MIFNKPSGEITMFNLTKALLLTVMLTLGTSAFPAFAKGNAFHEATKSYLVYLGVVPASLLDKAPSLVDQDKTLHGGVAEQLPSTQHVMVTVFRKDNNARVLNATVIAKVGRSKLLGFKGEEKPLEKMVTSNAVAYGNFFDMPERGEYRIEINIYESQKSGNESVRFEYEKY
ncbi:MAG: hypothetical protein Q8K52_01445 [Thiobacillus sp.]|nr:hypothetical protein [Thiobacillus sp.]